VPPTLRVALSSNDLTPVDASAAGADCETFVLLNECLNRGQVRCAMKTYVFSRHPGLVTRVGGVTGVQQVFDAIANGTPTEELVVALYLMPGRHDWAGIYHGAGKNACDLAPAKGQWSVVRGFPPPPDLPPQFKLIRMMFGMRVRYPKHERDAYGWESYYPSFTVHLAHMFAHEMYHYRRDLGLENGGEQAACKWSDLRATAAGFPVVSKKLPCRRQKRPTPDRLPAGVTMVYFGRMLRAVSRLTQAQLRDLQARAAARANELDRMERRMEVADQVAQIKNLPSGAEMCVRGRVPGRFAGQVVVKVRNLKSNRRVMVRTADGREWRFPMSCLLSKDSPS